MLTRAIVRPPAPNFCEGLTTADLGAPNYQRALIQHEDYCAALEQCGLTLTKLKPDLDYPDSTFVEDPAVIVTSHQGARAAETYDDLDGRFHPLTQVILTRPGAPSRSGEVDSMRRVLADFFPSLGEIQSPGTLDGGDVCEAGNHFFIGISERTNEAGAQQLAELLVPHGYTSSFVDISNSGTGVPPVTHAQDARATPGLLHLKSGLAYLGENRLAVIEALANRAEFAGYDLVRVDSEEEYATNCIQVNEHVLVAAGYPKFESKLRDLGYETIALDMSEFQKMDGGLSCLSLRF